VIDAIRELYRRIRDIVDDFRPGVISSYASSTAFYILLSLFPFMIVLISLLQYFPFDNGTLDFLNLSFFPPEVTDFLISTVKEIASNTSAAILPIASIGTLWSASRGIYSLTKGLNVIYRRQESRNYFVVRGLCLLYTVLFMVLLILVLAVLVFGNRLLSWLKTMLPLFDEWFFTSTLFRSFVTFTVLSVFFTLLYKTVPDRKAKWFGEVPGAMFSALAWIVFSYLYSLYIEYFAQYSNIYGSLTALILLMIWVEVCMYMLLIGAHINVTLQKHHRLGAALRKEE